jgi:hypothetical protein
MKIKRRFVLLTLIFILTLTVRLLFAFQTPNFSSDKAYFTLRQVEHITEHGLPIFEDPLSYSGRTLVQPPLFYYILSFFNLFLPITIVGKLLPNIFASLTIFITYLISLEITKNTKVAVFTSFISAFIPVFFSETVNNVSQYSLILPLIFFMLYCLIKIPKNKDFAIYFVITILLLSFTHPSVFIVVLSLILYTVLIKSENLFQNRAELEIIIFSTLFVIWSQFVIFKNAFLFHGPFVIWQNIPRSILTNYFSKITILEAISKIGIIPFIFGIYIIYKYVFKEKKRPIYLLLSFVFSVTALLWLRLIPLNAGLIILGAVLVLLFAQYFKLFLIYIQKTCFSKLENLFVALFILIFILTSVLPSLYYTNLTIASSISQNEINALNWLNRNTRESDVILTSPFEGHLITSVAKRKNVMDSNFLLIKDINQRFEDVRDIYTTSIETEAIDLLNKYDVSYIYFSDRAKSFFNKDSLSYVNDEECFELVYNKKIQIYQSLCTLVEK